MDWNAHIRAALAADRSGARSSPGKPQDWQPDTDADVVEELSQHAAAVYERARAEGLSTTEASRIFLDSASMGWISKTGSISLFAKRFTNVELRK